MRIKSILLRAFSILALVVVSLVTFEHFNNKGISGEEKVRKEIQSGMGLLVPGTEDLNELVGATEFILAVRIDKDYETLEVRKTQEDLYYVDRQYQMTIEKIFKEQNGNKYRPGNVIDLIVATGITQKKEGERGGIVPLMDQLPEFEDGEYLLFLSANNYKDFDNAEIGNFQYIDEKEVFQISNYHHIYKKVGSKYINIGSDLIPELTANDLEDLN